MKSYSIYNSASGIGDAVCALYVACGMADAHQCQVELQTNHSAWLGRASHPNVKFVKNTGIGPDMNADYGRQCRESRYGPSLSRARYYCDRVAEYYGIEPFKPARPKQFSLSFSPIKKGKYVVLVPFSNETIRTWPLPHWTKLADYLHEQGMGVVAIADGKRSDQVKRMFGDHVEYYWGMSVQWVLDLLFGAKLVIGNDSGIPHVCGLYSVPCISVLAHFDPDYVFEHAVNLVAAFPDESVLCRGCGMQSDAGYRGDKCGVPCSALMGIGPERVLSLALPLIS